jgi:hypothetical protein
VFLCLVTHEYGICFGLSFHVDKMHGITPNKSVEQSVRLR